MENASSKARVNTFYSGVVINPTTFCTVNGELISSLISFCLMWGTSHVEFTFLFTAVIQLAVIHQKDCRMDSTR